jgi:hypothetical protein
MIQRILRTTVVAVLFLLTCSVGPAQARYRYGSYGSATTDRGFFVEFEGLLANPRNADVVVATQEMIPGAGGVNTLSPIIPVWDDGFAGRIGLGYQWASGNKVSVSVWGFNTDRTASGNGAAGGVLHHGIGPPINTGSSYVGAFGSPGYYNIKTEIEAKTADLAWGYDHQLNESFKIEWSAALRYAVYEETSDGFYDNENAGGLNFGLNTYSAAKSLQGEMLGVKLAARGTYAVTQSWWFGAGLGFSFLDGELTGSSGLIPVGSANAGTEPSSFASITDDGRSGNIVDFDLRIGWRNVSDRFRVWLGWEQSIWNEIAQDPLRNFPGTTAPLRERDSVTFSGYKLGLYFRF